MAEKKKSKKMGRPRIITDWDEFDDLCRIHCTEVEIAQFYRCTIETVNESCKRDHGVTFLEYYGQSTVEGKRALRRTQYEVAVVDKNVPMLIFLGKQALGQKEKAETDISHEVRRPVILPDNGRS